jgi:hypothetical protein
VDRTHFHNHTALNGALAVEHGKIEFEGVRPFFNLS